MRGGPRGGGLRLKILGKNCGESWGMRRFMGRNGCGEQIAAAAVRFVFI